MIIFQLSEQLPNGFHDASILRIDINYAEHIADVYLQLWIGDSESAPHIDTYRNAVLRLNEFEYFAIDMPDPTYPYDQMPIVDLHDEVLPAPLAKHKEAFRFRMFVSRYNSFIHCCATSVTLDWQGEAFVAK